MCVKILRACLICYLALAILVTPKQAHAEVKCGASNGKTIGTEFVIKSCGNFNIYLMNGLECQGGNVTLSVSLGDWEYPASLTADYYAQNGNRVFRDTAGRRILAVHSNYTETLDGKDMSSYSIGSINYDVFDKILYPDPISVDGDNDHYLSCDNDCDDSNDQVHPGVLEICNDGIDNDCNIETDCSDSSCTSNPVCTPVSTDPAQEDNPVNECVFEK